MRTMGAAVAALALAACAGGESPDPPPDRPLKIEEVTLRMAAGANADTPARIDLVRVPTERGARALLGIETGAWFAGKRRAFLDAHPDTRLDDWEIPPGTAYGPEAIAVEHAVAGVLFCGLLASDAPPPAQRVERDGKLTVRIDDEGCTVEGGTPSKEPGWFSRWTGG